MLLDEVGALVVAEQPVRVSQRRHAFTFGCTGFEAISLANEELIGEDSRARRRPLRPLAGALQRRDASVLLGRVRATTWGAGYPSTASDGSLVRRPRRGRQRPSAVLAHRDGTLAVGPDHRRDRCGPGRPDKREVEDFSGLIDTWDVINEVVIMPVFDRYDNGITRLARELGRVGIVRLAFDAARAANPTATLLINDFDLSADYERLLEDCLAAGITIDAIGMQSHMHQGYWGEERTLELLDRYARFGLPLHWTEGTLVSGESDAAGDRRPQPPPGRRAAHDARRRGAPGRRGRAPLSNARRPPGSRRHYLVGPPGRRLAQRTQWVRSARWLRQARVRNPSPADQGRVVDGADGAANRRGRQYPLQRVPRNVRGGCIRAQRGRRPRRARRGGDPGDAPGRYAFRAKIGHGIGPPVLLSDVSRVCRLGDWLGDARSDAA